MKGCSQATVHLLENLDLQNAGRPQRIGGSTKHFPGQYNQVKNKHFQLVVKKNKHFSLVEEIRRKRLVFRK
jgi:hypothetical protein